MGLCGRSLATLRFKVLIQNIWIVPSAICEEIIDLRLMPVR